ncbi:hypothetical protein QWZ08_24495 [Ferruginibacter paludis]|uniref:hypothetical protein n=1 Tax=Ferruginibacter paludis TaxID=1310417 RepID=UPI0025B51163|nr:hypothetical protein [Ferruginibacter paludis]MDN3658826.1 hypothetical protein [Ferruginibacter paludis]
MSRKLEKFIGDNRNEFDDKMPSVKVWENIATSLVEKQPKKNILTPIFKWTVAAAIIITAGLIVFFVTNTNKIGREIGVTKKDSSVEVNAMVSENTPEVNEFAKLVLLKQEELKALAPEHPELYHQFTTDINQLDSSYKSLKGQLSITPNREMLIQAMVQNLQLQLNVLNQQLNIINQIKQSKKDDHEKSTPTI